MLNPSRLPLPRRYINWLGNIWNFLTGNDNRNARYMVEQHNAHNDDNLIGDVYAPTNQQPKRLDSKSGNVKPGSQQPSARVEKSDPQLADDEYPGGKVQSRTIHDLHEVVNTPLTYSTTLEPSTTHESSEENQAYQDWILIATKLTAADIVDDKVIAAFIPLLSEAIRGPITIWPHEHRTLRNEADVSDRLEKDALKPCKRAINLFLEAYYMRSGTTPPYVDYDCQRYHNAPDISDPSSKCLESYVDHVFLIRNGYGIRANDEFLVAIEEKKPQSVHIAELGVFAKSNQGAPISSGIINMYRHLSQLLKYVQTLDCPYTILADACEYIAMEWSEAEELDMKTAGENKAMAYWDMQGSEGVPFRLSVLYLLIKALRSRGYLMTEEEKAELEKANKKKEEGRARRRAELAVLRNLRERK
ncbi:hypothetical protein AURDEDRAFT_173105 [Auricularia subglabra TFB-10046 SS5]|nr:hypothetical protein AURDEDRAFT_173105 [Auricularia subglabra TFB-10046 SS5]